MVQSRSPKVPPRPAGQPPILRTLPQEIQPSFSFEFGGTATSVRSLTGSRMPNQLGWGLCLPITTLHPRQMHPEPFLSVAPGVLQGEAALAQNGFDHIVGVLVAVLGGNAFSRRERQVQVERRDEYRLQGGALQVGLDTRQPAVPHCDVAEAVDREVGIQLAIQAGKNVLVKRRRNSLRIVIRGQKNLGALGEIGAQQQSVARAQRPPNAAQNSYSLVRFEIPNTRSDVEHQLAPVDATQRRHASGVVRDDRIDPQLRKLPAEMRYCFLQSGRRNVNGIKQCAALAPQQFPNQNAGSGGCAGPEFDQSQRRSGVLQDLASVGLKNRPLGAREVVLRQLGDLLEEVRANLVVKQFRGKPLGCRTETLAHFQRNCVIRQELKLLASCHLPTVCP